MKFSTLFAVLATVATAVTAMLNGAVDARQLTNAQRLARNLSPNAPRNLWKPTPSYGGPPGKPSGSPNTCNTGSLQCCDTVGTCEDPNIAQLLSRYGVVADNKVPVGLSCSSIVGSTSCSQQPVCCDNNEYSGLFALGCISIEVGI